MFRTMNAEIIPPRRILGAIIAGGVARRFGADKGAALLNGVALIDHVAAALRPQVDALIIVGRDWAGLDAVPDAPIAGLGPLGGLNAALRHAAAHGFDTVLTAGCDTLPVPLDLVTTLMPGPAVIADQYLFGCWPVSLGDRLDLHTTHDAKRSMRGWIAAAGARQVASSVLFHNLNTAADLEAYAAYVLIPK